MCWVVRLQLGGFRLVGFRVLGLKGFRVYGFKVFFGLGFRGFRGFRGGRENYEGGGVPLKGTFRFLFKGLGFRV